MPDPVISQMSSDRRTSALVSLAIGPCGCGYGIECEDGETGQATVARWESEGATVERVPITEARERLVMDCPHEPSYGLLSASDARAEVARLRAALEKIANLPGHAAEWKRAAREALNGAEARKPESNGANQGDWHDANIGGC